MTAVDLTPSNNGLDAASVSVGDARASAPADAFRHELLPYTGGISGFVRATLPAITDALARGAPVLVAVGPRQISSLRQALDEQAAQVHFEDMHALGRNPARIIPAWCDLRDSLPNGSQPLGIGEPVWPGRSSAELSECRIHEALLDVAFAGCRPWRLLCPYDLDALDDDVIEAAALSHPPVVAHDGHIDDDAGFLAAQAHAPLEGGLPPAPDTAEELAFDADRELVALRRLVSRRATDAGLRVDRVAELALVVTELATNSIRHGGGRGALRVWREDERLLCEVRDDGQIADPLVGRKRPIPGSEGGQGLWLVNQLCDLVQIRSNASGSVVRVHLHLD
jgi:anti-sigma regulatory factor (Ser/Thr protein kinase)